jgi:acylglycerol lipase
MIIIALMYALLASTFVFNKVLLQTLPPIFLSGVLNLLGGGILVIYLLIKNPAHNILAKKSILQLIPIALCITYATASLKLYALSHLDVFRVTFLSALDPLIAAILCYFVKAERLTYVQIIGIVIAVLSSIPLCLTGTSTSAKGSGISLLPIVVLLAAIVINRYGWILTRDLLNRNTYTVTYIAALTMLMGGFASFCTSVIGEIMPSNIVSLPLLGMVLYVVIVNNVVCCQMYTMLLKKYSVTFLSLTEFFTPVFVGLYSWLFLREVISWYLFVSTAFVALGLFIFSYHNLFKQNRTNLDHNQINFKRSLRMSYPFSLTEVQDLSINHIALPEFLGASDGIKLAYYAFLPKQEPDSIVIFYHGGGLYSNKTYQWVGITLQEKYGIGCYMVDIRGHGYSEGTRGDAPSIEQVWDDIDTIVKYVQKRHPQKSLYLAGHSSGAGLILNYSLFNKQAPIAGYILVAPYLGPYAKTARKHDDISKSFIKKVRTWVYVGAALTKHRFFTHVPALFFNYSSDLLKQDPLVVPYYTYSMSCATSPMDSRHIFTQLNKPFALYIGEEDEQFIPQAVVAYKNYALQVETQSYAHIIPRVKHISLLLHAPDLIAQATKKLA